MTSKSRWTMFLFCDLLLFVWALNGTHYGRYFLVILLSFLIYRRGNPVIFKDYDERNRQRQAKYQKLQSDRKDQAIGPQ